MKTAFVITTFFALAFGQECGEKPDHPEWVPPPENWNVPEGHIVGGRDAPDRGYWPWQLSLQFDANAPPEGEDYPEDYEPNFRHTCGAVFIDEDFALTAAHCVHGRMVGLNDSRREDPQNFRLIFGGYNISDVDESVEQIVEIDMIVKHDRWAPDPYKGYPNDIALLRLVQDVDESDPNVARACVPRSNDFNFTANPDCWITGWGKVDWREDWIPDIMQEAKIEIPSNEWCFDRHIGYIRDTHICAGTGYPNACSGDSGGPMSCLVDGDWYLAGVTSWGVATCNTLPGVYTRVSKYWEWMDLVMALNRQ